MSKSLKGLILFVSILGSIIYLSSGMIFGFSGVNDVISLRTDKVRENAFMGLSPKEMQKLITNNINQAKSGADATIENILIKEEELVKLKAQQKTVDQEVNQTKEWLRKAIDWANKNPDGVYTSPSGKKYSFAQVKEEVGKKNKRLISISETKGKIDHQISQYEVFVADAKKQVDNYLNQVAQIKSKSDMAIADLTLRREIARGYSDLSNGKTIQAESFNNVEQMLGFVQDKLRSYDAVDYREQKIKENEPGIDFGTEKEKDESPFEEAARLLTTSEKNAIPKDEVQF